MVFVKNKSVISAIKSFSEICAGELWTGFIELQITKRNCFNLITENQFVIVSDPKNNLKKIKVTPV